MTDAPALDIFLPAPPPGPKGDPGLPGFTAPTRTALAAITTQVNGDPGYLNEPGREGWFTFSTANLSASVTADPGQGIFVAPASAPTGASGAWVRVDRAVLNVKWFGAKGDNSTDDTTAIQRAITYGCGLSSAKIFIPAGQCVFTNLTLPAYAGPQKVIEIVGEAQAATMFGTVGTSSMPTWGSIIKTAATTGTAALRVLPSGSTFSNYHLVLRDIIIRTSDNPQIAAVDASLCSQLSVYNCQIDTGVFNMQASLPTHSAALGIITPGIANGAVNRIINTVVSGYYIGADINEHCWGDYLTFASCLFAMRIQAANDASLFGRIGAYCCPTVVAVNGAHRFDIGQITIEHADIVGLGGNPAAPAWMAAIEDFRDIGNAARATVKIELVKCNVGPVALDSLIFNGGTGIHVTRAGDAVDSVGYHSITNPASIATGGSGTNLTWTAGVGNDSGLKIKSGDATKLQCVVPGLYEFSMRGAYAANATGSRQLILGVNGAAVDTDIRPNAGASLTTTPTIRVAVLLAKLDEVTVAGLQDSAGALNLTCSALLHKRIAANFTL